MQSFLRDLRFAARTLRKQPGLTALSVFTLGLGIGLTTVMFSIVNGALYRGLPFEDGHEILHLERANLEAGIESMEVTIHDFTDWRESQRSFEDLAAFYMGTVNISGDERAERFDGAFTTASTFALLGVQPQLGRLLAASDERPESPGVVLLGHQVWRDRYAADPQVVGRSLRVNGETMTVIGVMPEGFLFPLEQQVWLPLRMDPLQIPRGQGTTLEVMGRLRDGVTSDQALLDLTAIARRLAQDHPETNEGVGVLIKPFTDEYVGDEAKGLLLTMLGAVFLVLVIACANVANLLLARASVRGKEVAVRSAMGASRLRVVRQHLVESLALSSAGSALGMVIAWAGIRFFNRAIVVAEPPFWMEFGLLPPVLAFVALLTLFAAVAAGVMPAVKVSGADINAVLKDESRGSSGLRMGRLTRGLVVLEIALSVALLCAAGLMVKSVTKLRTTDFGFQREGILTGRVGLFEAEYPDPDSRRQFFESLRTRLTELPQVEAATLTTTLPGQGACCWRFAPEGQAYDRDQDYPVAARAAVGPDFFETFRIEILQGRGIERRDGPDELPVAVVNRAFEREFFPDGALGKRMRMGASDSEEPWLTIVGVAENAYMGGIGNDQPNRAGIYVSTAQSDTRFISLAVRTHQDPSTLINPVRDAVAAVDRDVPMYFAYTMDEAIRRNSWFYDIFGTLFMVFGGAALFLATIGLYGVMAFAVSRRTQEVGIRMALGATPRDVVTLILRQGLGQIALGAGAGLVLAFLLARMLRILLFEVSPTDPAIFAAILLILTTTGVLASLVPARRASRVDPMVAFRYE
ncbi:MAG: ABC transporter permease [Gemmatimonadota bacterium]